MMGHQVIYQDSQPKVFRIWCICPGNIEKTCSELVMPLLQVLVLLGEGALLAAGGLCRRSKLNLTLPPLLKVCTSVISAAIPFII